MKYILIFGISLFFLGLHAQEDSVKSKAKRELHLSLGTDFAAPVVGLFSDRNGFSLLANFQYFPKWFAQLQLGNENNMYEDIGWRVKSKGSFFKLGANFIITKDVHLKNNQFYIGGKIAYSRFTQDLQQVPIRAIGQTTQFLTLGEDKANVLWFELPIGARVNILKDKLFLESILSINVLIDSGSEMKIDPVVIPNFGNDNGGINFNLFWGVTYILF